MGLSSGQWTTADEIRLVARRAGVTVVNPCGERLSFHPDEARKLVEMLSAAIERSEKLSAEVTLMEQSTTV